MPTTKSSCQAFARGSRGQHVNKASTAIHLRFDIKASSLPEFYKERLLAASHHLISADGVVIIKAQEYRSQEMNREAAIARLVALIKELTAEKVAGRRDRLGHRKSDALLRRHRSPQSRRCVGKFASEGVGERVKWMIKSKVKKIVFSVIAACSLFALFGCKPSRRVDTVQPAAMEELKPMQQSWRGVLPCADCEGIDTSLFLEKDGTWVMNEHYLGRPS